MAMIMENYRIIFIAKNLFFVFVFLVWVYFIFPSRDDENKAKAAEKIEFMFKKLGLTNQTEDNFIFSSEEISTIKQCYLKKINSLIEMPNINSTLDWMEVGHFPTRCASFLDSKLSPFIATANLYENKYFLYPKINDSCAVITFGIGHEVENELFLKTNFPQCSFLGIDPDPIINEALFQQKIIGHFVKAAVGGKTEKGKITRLDTTELINHYEVVQKNSASDLIKTYHGKDRPIDLVNFDIEGAEFEVFEAFPNDSSYKQICQFNVEFHHPLEIKSDYTVANALKVLRDFISDGTFVWIKSEILFDTYFPSYFINVKNRYCFEKYLKERINV